MAKTAKKPQFLNVLKEQYFWFAVGVLLVQAMGVIFPINIWFAFIPFMVNFVSFLLVKEFIDEKTKKRSFLIFKLSIPIFMMGASSLLGKALSSLTGKSGFNPISILFHIAVLITAVVFSLDKDKKKMLDNIYSSNPMENLKKKEQVKEKGDVELCIDMATEKPVILPFKDRFLHMLILGPTGSGKTSQILLPLINQDIQEEGYGVTVIEPKGDLAEKVAAMGRYHGKEVVYFNPTHMNCPYFNPLYGPEDEVLENMATTFKMLNPDSPQFFQDMNETLIRNSLKVLKRLKGNTATLLDLSTLVYNSNGQGRILVNNFAKLSGVGITAEMSKENGEIASWFISEYYNEKSKVYEHCSGLRSQVAKITSNSHLRRVLNPPNGENDVNFEKIIDEGKILAISTAQGDLRDLGRFLGYFIILNFQSSVFKRPGNENTRRPHFLYIDEFQTYSNPGFADMLTQGRSYRVASHLATQNRALMAMGGGKDGNNFVELVSTNARNVVIFPGGNSKDAKYYSDEFGEHVLLKEHKSTSSTKFNLLYGFQKMGYPSETYREEEVKEARFSHSDVIYNKFGEVIYRIVSNNTVQVPGKGRVSWLPKDYNSVIDKMVAEYDAAQKGIGLAEDCPDDEEQEFLFNDDKPQSQVPVFTKTKPVIEPTKTKGSMFKEPESDEDEIFDVMAEDTVPVVAPPKKEKESLILDFDSEDLDDLI